MAVRKHSPFALVAASLFWCLCAHAQSNSSAVGSATCLRAIYQLDYKPDSSVTAPKRVQMILRVSNGASRFESTGKHMMDSVYMSLSNLTQQERLQQSADATQRTVKNEFRYTVFKEPAKNLVAFHDGIGTIDHQYKEQMPLFAWRLTPQKKSIAGHECQQAYAQFGGRMWEAWFARDVPVSDGPYKFYGLPGLILQVRDTHDNYTFSLLCLDTHPQPFDAAADVDAPLSAKAAAPVVSKAQFLQAKYNDELTLIDRMRSWGNKIPESMEHDYLEKLRRRNNPLERK